MPTKAKENNQEIKKQSITMSTIMGKAIEAVVAYIVLFFFKPVWNKLVKWWKGKDESNS
jgi:hypothetical protein|tara:strand:+ start:1378 stop:1554 length:177 start_codon:yes stop_codon:yes gene_type:complete